MARGVYHFLGSSSGEVHLTREQRRLAAIVAADVVGYSRLMGRDESGTLVRLREHRKQRFEPTLVRHGGRLVKLTGDGALVEFASAVDALSAAIEFQQAMAEANRDQPEDTAIVFRIGLHLGDLIVDGDDLYGDGVNVAARLETEAPPGGILISGNVHDAAAGRLKANFDDLGRLALKNIERPVQAFGVKWDPADWRTPAAATPSTAAPPTADTRLALPDKPSIAVLPFQNMSSDPEQEYFADGMVEDIITALSRFRSLFVVARNSSFTYRGKAIDIRQVGRELGVRYVLEGSVRKAAGKVRITGQLIDAATGTHLWADRFDGSLNDIFELQDQVTTSVVGAVAPTLDQAEMERAKRKPTANLDVYDYYLRGTANFNQWTRETNSEALRLFQKAMELDSDFAPAYGRAASCYIHRKMNGWMNDRVDENVAAARLAQRAADLGRDDAEVLSEAGFVIAYIVGDLDSGAAFIDQALILNPNWAGAWRWGGWIKTWLGDPEMALERFKHAIRLSPLDPLNFTTHAGIAAAHFFADRYDEASLWAEKAGREKPDLTLGWRYLAASHARAGRIKEAQKAMEKLREIDPMLRVSNLKDTTPFNLPQDYLARYEEGLRKAGLPE